MPTKTLEKRSRWNPYPWEDWFNRRKFKLTRHKDFSCRTYSMATQIRNALARFERRASIKVEEKYGQETILVTME